MFIHTSPTFSMCFSYINKKLYINRYNRQHHVLTSSEIITEVLNM